MRGIALALAALALTACSPERKQMLRERYNLVPPTLQRDAEVDGQRVALDRYQALVVRLDEDPLYGQRWELKPLDSHVVVAPVQHDFTVAPGTDPRAAVPGLALFRFRGVAPGVQPVELRYKRPNEEAASRTIRFEVAVR